MKAISTAFLSAVLLCSAAQAQWYDTQTRKPLPDTEWRKTSGALGAALLLTDKPDAFMKEWTETPESHMPLLKPVSVVKRGDVVAALVLFSGCGSKTSTCSAHVDFKVLKPDGSVYGDVPGNPAWSGASPKVGIVVLSKAQLRVRIEPNDPLGTYQVLATMTDTNANTSIRLKQTFQVKK